MNIEVRCAYPDTLIFGNVSKNAETCQDWLNDVPAHDGHAVIVGGGPSLVDKLALIKNRVALGQTVFALNGAGPFLNRHGILPKYQVFLDCNPDLKDRIGVAETYLMGSQCDPSMVAAVPKPVLWHTAIEGIEDHFPPAWREKGGYCLIGGAGATVGLSSLPLAYALGFRKLHLFGYDSSVSRGKLHGYHVEGEDSAKIEMFCGVPIGYSDVELNGRNFKSTLTMTRQAELFPEVCNALLEQGCIVTVDVHEDSLMAEVLRMMRSTQPMAA